MLRMPELHCAAPQAFCTYLLPAAFLSFAKRAQQLDTDAAGCQCQQTHCVFADRALQRGQAVGLHELSSAWARGGVWVEQGQHKGCLLGPGLQQLHGQDPMPQSAEVLQAFLGAHHRVEELEEQHTLQDADCSGQDILFGAVSFGRVLDECSFSAVFRSQKQAPWSELCQIR